MKLSQNIIFSNLKYLNKILFVFLFIFVLAFTNAFAHQPRIVTERQTNVLEPEISKAYYGKLTGIPDTYTIFASSSFDLYVNVLVPDIPNQNKDIVVSIFKDEKLFMVLGGTQFAWTKMFEKFGYDNYWAGPEYKSKAEAGNYVITVSSKENNSKYSLAIGEAENFDFKEIMNALKLVPELKISFFDESPISFIFSQFGWGLILALYILASIFGFLFNLILSKNKVKVNLNTRFILFLLGITFLFLAITTTWNLVIIFISGFLVYQAIFYPNKI